MLNVPFRPWTRDYIKHEEAHTQKEKLKVMVHEAEKWAKIICIKTTNFKLYISLGVIKSVCFFFLTAEIGDF